MTAGTLALGIAISPITAFSFSDKDYQNVAISGKIVVMINYLDSSMLPTSAMRLVLDKTPDVVNPTTIDMGAIKIELSGIESCGDFEIQTLDYSGSCNEVAITVLQDAIRHSDVWICNAFNQQKNKSHQFASCFTRTALPDNIVFKGMLEDELVGLGSHRITLAKDGEPLRPDLLGAQKTAIENGFLMWSKLNE